MYVLGIVAGRLAAVVVPVAVAVLLAALLSPAVAPMGVRTRVDVAGRRGLAALDSYVRATSRTFPAGPDVGRLLTVAASHRHVSSPPPSKGRRAADE